MRIITQDGYGDIPYGLVIFTIENSGYDFRILGRSQHIGDNVILVASYKTKEKARKAMYMLHEQYKRKEIVGFNIFRFPKDEEIEVDE